MAQLARFHVTFASPSTGLPLSGASVTVYREGATVSGNQSGTSPLTVTVRHRGKIEGGDSAFVGDDTATVHSVDSVTATTVVLSGFAGTLVLADGNRIVPSNNLPTLYGDDQGGATTANPLTTDANGLAEAWLEAAAYEYVVSGSGVTTTLYEGVVFVDEFPADRYDVRIFGATGGGTTDDTLAIQNAIDTAETMGGGIVYFPVPAVDYLFSEITVQAAGVSLVGADPNNCVLRSSSTTGTAILFDKSVGRAENFVLDATAARTAVSSTAYADGTPTAGKHGIAFIPSNQATTQALGVIRGVTVKNQPDDGIICEQPELLVMENCQAESNGRFGIHLNGQANSIGISNMLINCRGISNGSNGIFIRSILHTTLINPQGLQNDGTEQIWIRGGRSVILIEPDIEDTASNANVGVKLTGEKHESRGGLFVAFQTPIELSSADHCTIDRPHVANAGFTAADQVVKMDGSSDYNLLRIGPLSSHTNVTNLTNAVGNWATAVGNVILPSPFLITSFTAGDATPAVNLGFGPYKTVNTAPTTITAFDSGSVGQVIHVIIGDADTTIDFTGTTLMGNGGADWTPTTNDSMICVFDGTNWLCRISDNTA